jgi:hypothetical protein
LPPKESKHFKSENLKLRGGCTERWKEWAGWEEYRVTFNECMYTHIFD